MRRVRLTPRRRGWARHFECSFQAFTGHAPAIVAALGIEGSNRELVAQLVDRLTEAIPDLVPGLSRILWFDQSLSVTITDDPSTPTELMLECVCSRPLYISISRYPWAVGIGALRLWEESPRSRYKGRAGRGFGAAAPMVEDVVETVINLCVEHVLQPGETRVVEGPGHDDED